MNRIRPLVWVASLATAVLLLTACETPLDRAYGLAQREHLALTIENPDAGMDDLEAPRPDGPSTGAALGKYRKTETEIDRGEPPSVINVDIGS